MLFVFFVDGEISYQSLLARYLGVIAFSQLPVGEMTDTEASARDCARYGVDRVGSTPDHNDVFMTPVCI